MDMGHPAISGDIWKAWLSSCHSKRLYQTMWNLCSLRSKLSYDNYQGNIWATLYRKMFTLQKPMHPQEHKQETLLRAGSASQQIIKTCKTVHKTTKHFPHFLALFPQNRLENNNTSVTVTPKIIRERQ